MKSVVLFLLAAVCLAHAIHPPTRTADKAHLIKQKSVYELVWHVDQPTVYHPELYQKARSFSLEDNIASFNNQKAVTEFLQRWKHGMLPRGEIFSPMHPQHLQEAVCLFHVLQSAKDFDTFYNAAVWARFYVNERMYIYVLYTTVMHRQDTKYIQMPPLYEVLPHMHFNDDVLYKAYHIGMGNAVGTKKTISGVDHYYIPYNYTGWYIVRDDVPEQKLSYFTEDVDLNNLYFYMKHDFPIWMSSTEYADKMHLNMRGEIYLYLLNQLLARYYQERLSNDMGEIDYVDLNKPIVNGYYPTMHQHNGVPFYQRPVDSKIPLHMHKEVQAAQDFHERISDAIDSGYIVDKNGKHIHIYNSEGLNHLGNIIQGNADSLNKMYYGNLEHFYKNILGLKPEPITKYNIVPTALDFYCTSLRDPVTYSMYKNILTYFIRYKEHLPRYTHEELVSPGLKIESVTVDKLMTYFEPFESMINNAMSVRSHKEAQATLVKARQYRLNHKPFTYTIMVNSDKNMKAMVRTFFGPKYDVHGHELHLSENYMNFLQMDQWIVDLKAGTNKIERSSHEVAYTVPDQTPSEVFYKKVVKAIEGGESFTYPTRLSGFPDRLIIPKGKKEGMPFKIVVCVSHVDETKIFEIETPVWGLNALDGHSIGYPLDRPMHSFTFNKVPNFYMKDVVVYHKQAEELNLTM